MGEYVSLGKVESVLKTHPLIENICVYGDSTENYCVALIVPHRDNLAVLAVENGIDSEEFEKLCDDQKLTDIVLTELKTYGKEGKENINFKLL